MHTPRDMRQRVRVALMRLPARLRDIVVDALADAGDIDVVCTDMTRIDSRRADVDLVIACATDRDGGDVSALLSTAPEVRVLSIATAGCRAALYQLQPQWIPLGELSRNGLIEAVRIGSNDAAWRPLPADRPEPSVPVESKDERR